jgi:hypothetical protein
MLLSKKKSAPQTSENYSVGELRDRGWTRYESPFPGSGGPFRQIQYGETLLEALPD